MISPYLETARDQALAGNYSGASSTFAHGWSLRWTQTFHPGYELQLSTPGMTTVNDFARITDFRTGEVTHTWTDQYGTWKRHVFVSRADQVIVHKLLPATGRTVDTTISVNTALAGVPTSVSFSATATVTSGDGYLNLRGTYPSGGAYGYEGVTRVVVSGSGSSVTADGQTLVVAKATKVLLLTKLGRYETSTGWNSQPLQTALAALTADYATLLGRHAPKHQAMYDRSSIDLNVSAADRRLATSELIARQNSNASAIDVALLERMYDSGRYLFISSSGVLPPRLTGIWTGTWNGSWADDITTDANINLQVAGANINLQVAGGNILDLTDARQGYFDLILGQLAHWRDNATNLYGARGFLAPSRTDGEYGHMLHFNSGSFPGEAWTGGADWLLYPLLEYYQVTGDSAFLKNKLGPALMELALFYEDFLTCTDSSGKAVFVPSFSMENSPTSTGQAFSINATGDIMAGRHALQAAIDAANTLPRPSRRTGSASTPPAASRPTGAASEHPGSPGIPDTSCWASPTSAHRSPARRASTAALRSWRSAPTAPRSRTATHGSASPAECPSDRPSTPPSSPTRPPMSCPTASACWWATASWSAAPTGPTTQSPTRAALPRTHVSSPSTGTGSRCPLPTATATPTAGSGGRAPTGCTWCATLSTSRPSRSSRSWAGSPTTRRAAATTSLTSRSCRTPRPPTGRWSSGPAISCGSTRPAWSPSRGAGPATDGPPSASRPWSPTTSTAGRPTWPPAAPGR
ncbi:glycoside hydrolase N-terminal domain-containing protein [Streptomyces sp. NPDC059679]|uniref:glycosyl hydrolase family 95 catalytic domain-containing protein n=1 Tax=Streptomyces sp. NPDC059679 TaxID=3346903 RepID=UPI0036959082